MPPRDPQGSSSFFQKLPPELRLDIYSYIFCSTRLSFGKQPAWEAGERINIRLRPARNSLSALRVCRRFNDEIGDSWLGQVLFHFNDPETMLDKLTDLNRQTLGKLRHMRYSCGYPMELYTWRSCVENAPYTCFFYLPEILKLLPGLRLDRLTVVGEPTAQERYFRLDALVKHSDGWKELYYLSDNSVMLGFGKRDKSFLRLGRRAPQPSAWAQALAARDGPTASVNIYRSTDAALSGSMISKPATCQAFADQVAEAGKESQYGNERDSTLIIPGEKEKEILVVARRGSSVDYTENGTSPVMANGRRQIREFWPDMTWGQIRYMGIGWHEEMLGRELEEDEEEDEEEDDDESEYEIATSEDLQWLGYMLRPVLHRDDRPHDSDAAAGIEVDERGCPIKEDCYRHSDDYEWAPYYSNLSPD